MTNQPCFSVNRASGLSAWQGWRWLFIVILSLQLLMAALHNHDVSKERVSDCVACSLASQNSGGALPSTPVFIAAVLTAFVLARRARYVFLPQYLRHLLPLSQAPPDATPARR